MKLRLDGNSIRLRLAQADLKALLKHGTVEERMAFPDGRELVYALVTSSGRQANFDGTVLVVTVGREDASALKVGDSVEFLTGPGDLRVLVEMDLHCQKHCKHDSSRAEPL